MTRSRRRATSSPCRAIRRSCRSTSSTRLAAGLARERRAARGRAHVRPAASGVRARRARDVLPHLDGVPRARRAQDRRVVRDAARRRGRVRRRGRRVSQHQHARRAGGRGDPRGPRRRERRARRAARRAAPRGTRAGRDNNFQLIRFARGGVGDPVPLLRADRALDRRAAVAARAELNLGALGVEMLFRAVRIPRHAELARAPRGRAVRRCARAAHLPGAGRGDGVHDRRSRARRARCAGPSSSPHPQTLDYAWRVALGWDDASTACPARFRPIRFRTTSTARCGRCRSSCACTSPARRGRRWACSRAALAWLAAALVLVALFARVAGVVPARARTTRSCASSRCCSRWARSRTSGATRIPLSLAGAAVAVALVAWNPARPRARRRCSRRCSPTSCSSSPTIRALRWPAFDRVGDYSYGLYVYSFPIQQTIVQRVPGIEPAGLFALSLAATLAVAALSWHVLERPALATKIAFRTERRQRHDTHPRRCARSPAPTTTIRTRCRSTGRAR